MEKFAPGGDESHGIVSSRDVFDVPLRFNKAMLFLSQEENIFGTIKMYIQISSSNISAHIVAPSSLEKNVEILCIFFTEECATLCAQIFELEI